MQLCLGWFQFSWCFFFSSKHRKIYWYVKYGNKYFQNSKLESQFCILNYVCLLKIYIYTCGCGRSMSSWHSLKQVENVEHTTVQHIWQSMWNMDITSINFHRVPFLIISFYIKKHMIPLIYEYMLTEHRKIIWPFITISGCFLNYHLMLLLSYARNFYIGSSEFRWEHTWFWPNGIFNERRCSKSFNLQ